MRVLMVTFPFPPMAGSSGVHRPEKFSRFLAESGVSVDVLTCHPRAYERVSPAPASVPTGVSVTRAFCLDAARHLAIGGWYPRILALPDRWASWIPFAVLKGIGLMRRAKPDAIWSTYPIASAHLIGAILSKITGVPWIADFRDPMIESEYEAQQYGRLQASIVRYIEKVTARNAKYCVVTTTGMQELYCKKYGAFDNEKWIVIPNGFDEEDFSAQLPPERAVERVGPFRILHSGTVYSSERDPRPLFEAMGRLKSKQILTPSNFRLLLRAPGDVEGLLRMLRVAKCEELVEILPGIAHRDAIAEMLAADALLLLQAANCNRQIPAKAYEYIRTGKPILALTDENGDTFRLLSQVPAAKRVPIADAAQIEIGLPQFVDWAKSATTGSPNAEWLRRYSRRAQAEQLLHLLGRATHGLAQ